MVAHASRLPDPDETIVALATPSGPGLRGIIRLSGRNVWSVVRKLTSNLVATMPAKRACIPVSIQLPTFHAPLDARLLVYRGPRSYTGQDLVEIHTLSCPPLLEKILHECQSHGARSAQPGEFTLRTFLAGKLDLTQAEAILGVIEATGEKELSEALRQLAGGLTHPLQELREDLLNLLADVEAALDFADEDLQFVREDEMLRRLMRGLAMITNLKRQVDQRALGQRPFRVVLAGPVNAGKSSLFNALIGRKAALVSPQPGTTRDYLEKQITLEGQPFDLVDTAGLRETADTLESASQVLGEEQHQKADLILWCRPADDPNAPPVPVALSNRSVEIFTKADLVATPEGAIGVSSLWEEGLERLREVIVQRASVASRLGLAFSLSRARHHVDACLGHLRQAHGLVLQQQMPELLALELRLAIDELGAMVGAVYTDDLLDRIFSRFCIGK